MIKHIIHTADWHYCQKNQSNFWYTAKNYFDLVKNFISSNNLQKDEVVQVIAGDLFHNHMKSTVDDFINVKEFLKQCGEISHTKVFIGNHDYNVNNKSMGDMLTKLFDSSIIENVLYYRDSQVIECDNLRLVNISKFQDNKIPVDLKTLRNDKINIGVYHDPLFEASVNEGSEFFSFFRDKPSVSIFNGLDAVIMGDIHKHQSIKFDTGTAVYAGNPYQQSFKEPLLERGAVIWSVNDNKISYKLHQIESLYNFIKVKLSDINNLGNLNEEDRVEILFENSLTSLEERIKIKEITDKFGLKERNVNIKVVTNIEDNLSAKIEESFSEQTELSALYDDYLKNDNVNVKNKFFEIDVLVNKKYERNDKTNFKIIYIRGAYIKSFGDFNFSFDEYDSNILINSNPSNFGGKSNFFNLFDILLYGKCRQEDEISTLDNIVNYYTPKGKLPFVEGIVESKGERYFIRREYDFTSSGKIKHKFFCYKIVNKNETEFFLEIEENYANLINKEEVSEEDFGYWVIDLKDQNNNLTLKNFESIIGTLNDNNDISYINIDNIKKLLITKATERTRNFYDMFGGSFFTEKKKEAQALYSTWKKTSKLGFYDPISINEEILILKEQIKNIKHDLKIKTNEKNNSSIKLEGLEKELDKLKKDLVYVPEEIENSEYLLLQLDKLKNEIKIKNQSLLTVYDKEKLLKEKQDLVSKIDQLIIPKEKTDEIIKINNNRLDKNPKVSLLINQKTQLTTKVKLLNEEADKYTKKISAMPEKVDCNICGDTVVNSRNINIAKETLNEIIINTNNTVKLLNEINDELKELEDKHVTELEAFNKVKDQKIAKLKEKYDSEYRGYISVKNNLNNSIKNVDIELKKHETNLILEMEIKSLEKDLKSIKTRIANNEKYISDYRKNQAINLAIKEIEVKKQSLKNTLIILNTSLNSKEIELLHKKDKLTERRSILDTLKEDVLFDKAFQTYIKAHDKDGIIKGLIQQYLKQINDEIKNLMSDLDFCCRVAIVKNVVEYYIVRNNVEYSLKEGSGLEIYASLLVLNLVHINFSKSNLSNFVRFDEIFGPISSNNFPIIYKIIQKYNSVFSTLFIITHREDVKEYFDNESILFIQKENNFSKIK